jgi:hypothetical protein
MTISGYLHKPSDYYNVLFDANEKHLTRCLIYYISANFYNKHNRQTCVLESLIVGKYKVMLKI